MFIKFYFLKMFLMIASFQQEILDGRLNARVDDMIERGLVEELLDFHRNYNLTRIANKDT